MNIKQSVYLNCLKTIIQLLDCPNQTTESQSRQGFQPLRAFGDLIGLTMAVQIIYTHYMTLPKIFIQLPDCLVQTARSQSRQGFQPLQDSDSLIRSAMAVRMAKLKPID